MRIILRNTLLCLLVATIFMMPISAVKNEVKMEEWSHVGLLDQLDQSQTQYQDSIKIETGLAQSFRPSLPLLTRFSILVSTEFDIAGQWTFINYDISLRKGSLTGPDIITVNLPTSELAMGSTFWLTIYSYSPIPVSIGTDYYIVIEGGLTYWEDHADMYWFCGTLDQYPNGAGYSYHDGQWWVLPGWSVDFCFKTYGESGGGGNNPPHTPDTPTGPTSGTPGTTYTYSASTIDPDGDQVKYYFDWGDGTGDWTSYASSGSTKSASHSWSGGGTYQVKVKAQDDNGADSDYSATLTVVISSNNAPNKPSTPSGPTTGRTGKPYSYSTSTNDPDGNKVYYNFSWGDNTYSGWLGPYDSGLVVTASHTWSNQGTLNIQVKAKDEHGAESVWSDPLTISMPKNSILDINPLILQFLENHPHLFPILRQIFLFLG